MADISTGVGLRHVRIGLRDDTDGVMARPTGHVPGAVWPGLQLSGAATLTLNIPDPERVDARGDDQVYHTFHMPPTEGVTAELVCTKRDQVAIALMTSTVQWGTATLYEGVAMATDKQGLEPNMVMWAQRKGIDSDPASAGYGTEVWEVVEISCCKMSPAHPSAEQSSVGEMRYAITIDKVGTRITGQGYTEVLHGCTLAAIFAITSVPGKMFYDFDEGNAVETDFVLTHVPTSAIDIEVYMAGVNEPAGWTLDVATQTVQFVAAPADGDPLVFVYCTDDVLS